MTRTRRKEYAVTIQFVQAAIWGCAIVGCTNLQRSRFAITKAKMRKVGVTLINEATKLLRTIKQPESRTRLEFCSFAPREFLAQRFWVSNALTTFQHQPERRIE